MVDSRGAGAKPNGMPMHSHFTPLPHEPHDLAVLTAQEEVMVEVADVDLGHVIVAAEHLSYCVQALHLEVLVTDALVGLPQVDTSPHLVGALLGHREEGRPMTICRVRRKDPDRADVEIVLQGLAAGYPFLAARLES